MVAFYEDWVHKYPIILSRTGLPKTTGKAGSCCANVWAIRCRLSATILLVTNVERGSRGSTESGEPDPDQIEQIGSLTETLAAIEMAKRAAWPAVVSTVVARRKAHHDC